jgi:hypothetical protein
MLNEATTGSGPAALAMDGSNVQVVRADRANSFSVMRFIDGFQRI